MTTPLMLVVFGGLLAAAGPRLLLRARWTVREPIVGLWVWQCLVVAVLTAFTLALLLTTAAAWEPLRERLFTGAPSEVPQAYDLEGWHPWSAVCAGALALAGAHVLLSLGRQILIARATRRRRRRELLGAAPLMPGETPPRRRRLVVREDPRPEAWSLPGLADCLVVSTGALRRLTPEELEAVRTHEHNHSRYRHHWLLQSAWALSAAFPRVPVFAAFAEQVHTLVEMAADDAASRRHGRLSTALALIGLNERRSPGHRRLAFGETARRADRLLLGPDRLPPSARLGVTVTALAVPLLPVLLAAAPGLSVL
ncbi:M56 family metallopeptidase [Allostreptomyces psammosilenae]|uniref:Zn-dependent protease with chaperone function n=1 Tax=Allostreptomyces psammosilenae TaxID=1892865 RepID=A0A853A9W0_9ACTN|nr:M56 family metallopeptidase [Allostreptomyces psammosilenae]NYI07411.1 Zn-dependent protease with chaperone function [Allostreptomyces psammosilenae]